MGLVCEGTYFQGARVKQRLLYWQSPVGRIDSLHAVGLDSGADHAARRL